MHTLDRSAILILICAAALCPGLAGAAQKAQGWRPLFDGKTLQGWKSTDFGGQGDVTVKNGQIILERGNPLTGITWTGGDIPRMNYEISLEAMRLNGSDFFVGLTFPVANSHCSLILGGWGGSVVGLSSLDGMDASENETSTVINFADNRWYRVRVKVTPEKIVAWLDDKVIVDADTRGRQISVRVEVLPSQPLGVASYVTESALRDIKVRKL
ncbi:MAG: DUF1080 domain-containing protein [Acidobacteria bacterium]|nr:DUF1080 domain-containing protein [Acidobacteriota bacterium]